MHVGRTHPSNKRGKSGVEKIRDKLDAAYILWRDYSETAEEGPDPMFVADYEYARGIACALGILRGTDEYIEMQEAEERYEP